MHNHTVVSAERNKALNASRLKWDDYCHSRSDISKLGLRLCKKLATKYVCKHKSAATFAATGVMVVNPSQLGLATDLKLSPRSGRRLVRKVLRNLISVGVLRVRSKGGVGGRGTNTEYEMVFPAQEGAPREQNKGHQKGHQQGATKGHQTGTERGTVQVQEGAPHGATSFSLTSSSLINFERVAPTKKKNEGSTAPPHSSPVDLQTLEALWPRKNQDAAALDLAWRKVVASGVDPAFVLKQADRWCLWWSAGTPTNKIPHLGQWLASGGFRKQPPFDASYPEWYARMLRRAKSIPEQEPEPIKKPEPVAPVPSFDRAVDLNLHHEDNETRARIKAEILEYERKYRLKLKGEPEDGGMF